MLPAGLCKVVHHRCFLVRNAVSLSCCLIYFSGGESRLYWRSEIIDYVGSTVGIMLCDNSISVRDKVMKIKGAWIPLIVGDVALTFVASVI